IPQNVVESMAWQRAMSQIAGDPSMVVAVEGFTACVGQSGENFELREARRLAILNGMPNEARARVLFSFTPGTNTYLGPNATQSERAGNRAVRVTYRSIPPAGRDPC